LIDLAIVIGTDFNDGIKGIGPKTALRLIKQHGSLENFPENLKERLPRDLMTIRNIFLNPNVTENYSTSQQPVKEDDIIAFLCDERGFSKERVKVAMERMRTVSRRRSESGLTRWLDR
jgi:flap endonuclease-1